MSYAYINEKAAVAIYALAVRDSSLDHRIANAWISALDRLQHGADDWSAVQDTEAPEIYARLRAKLSETPSDGNTPGVLVALTAMTTQEQLEIARDIINFHAEVMPV
jgi:hypothetical protein